MALLSPHIDQQTGLSLVLSDRVRTAVDAGGPDCRPQRSRPGSHVRGKVVAGATDLRGQQECDSPAVPGIRRSRAGRICDPFLRSRDHGHTDIARNMPWLSRWVVRKLFPLLVRSDGFSTPQRSAGWLCDTLARGALPVGMSYAKLDGFTSAPAVAAHDSTAEELFDAVNAAAEVTDEFTAAWWWESRADLPDA